MARCFWRLCAAYYRADYLPILIYTYRRTFTHALTHYNMTTPNAMVNMMLRVDLPYPRQESNLRTRLRRPLLYPTELRGREVCSSIAITRII